MKKPYRKPMLAVEHYSLTQSISSCVGIKINAVNSECVRNDPDSTNMMKNWAFRGGFLSGACQRNMTGYQEDGICYHTSINAAFTS